MSRTTINRLIITSPCEEPQRHWRYDRERCTFDLMESRRPAGYAVATPDSTCFEDPGIFIEIVLPNRIPPRVKAAEKREVLKTPSLAMRKLLDKEARISRQALSVTLDWSAKQPDKGSVVVLLMARNSGGGDQWKHLN